MEKDVLQTTINNLKEQLKAMADSSTALRNDSSSKELDLQKQILELQGARDLQVSTIQRAVSKEYSWYVTLFDIVVLVLKECCSH